MRRFQTGFLFLLLASILQAQWRTKTPVAVQAPEHLLCESMEEPLGLGTTLPRFSWQMRDDRRGAIQMAYQIRVATSVERLQDGTPDVWDSGRIETSESVNVVYGGARVVSRRRYFWEVRVWDREGNVSAYSKPSWWEMGLLASTDWEAEWITPNPGIDRGEYDWDANWIWGSEEDALRHAQPGKRFFRFHFSLPQQPEKATLLITAKDHVGVWLNGKSLLDPEKSSELGLPRETWSYSRQISLTGSISQGANILAVEASVDASTEPDEPTPAGMIALLRAQMPDGTVKAFTSGPSWITSREQITNWSSNAEGLRFARAESRSRRDQPAATAGMSPTPLRFQQPNELAGLLAGLASPANTLHFLRDLVHASPARLRKSQESLPNFSCGCAQE